MSLPVRSKKMAISEPSGKYPQPLDITTGKWSASVMADRILRLDRRELVAGLGAVLLGPAMPGGAATGARVWGGFGTRLAGSGHAGGRCHRRAPAARSSGQGQCNRFAAGSGGNPD